jgi:hypothetical protein
MSFGGSTSTKDSSSTSTQTLDPRLADTVYGNVARVQNMADTGFQPYTGQQVAGFTPDQTAAQGAYAGIGNGQVGSSTLQSAISGAQGVAGYAPSPVSAQTISANPLTSVDLSGYMNPYTSGVINSTLADLNRQQQIQDQTDAAKATAAGAFGGSRSAVLQNLDHDSYARTAASTLAGLNQANFTQAQTAAQSDLARQLTASQANQSAALQAAQFNQNTGLQAAGLNLNAAGALAGMSGQQLSQALQQAGALQTAGDAQQKNQQAQLDAAYQQWLMAQQYPIQIQGLLNQAIGEIPRTTNTATTGDDTETQAGFSGLKSLGGIGTFFG